MSIKWERWNTNELTILKVHSPNAPREDIMHLLPGRPWRGIVNQAGKQKIHRPHYGTVRSAEYLAELHTTLSTARTNRTDGYAPFAGKQHSAESKLHISVSNLHARGHSIADIAERNRIAEKEVVKIIEIGKNG